MDKKVDIVALSWNGWQHPIVWIKNVQQFDQTDASLYIVDNVSSDGSEERVRVWEPAFRIVQAGRKLSWAGGQKLAIPAAGPVAVAASIFRRAMRLFWAISQMAHRFIES